MLKLGSKEVPQSAHLSEGGGGEEGGGGAKYYEMYVDFDSVRLP